ncbi:MAG: hypothetical protein ACOVQX_05000 [Legionella sp.]
MKNKYLDAALSHYKENMNDWLVDKARALGCLKPIKSTINQNQLASINNIQQWETIRNAIINCKEDIAEKQWSCDSKEKLELFFAQLFLYEKMIEAAENYLLSKDPDLLNEKSRDRINFLTEQLLPQPSRILDVNHGEKNKSSAAIEISMFNKLMLSVMRTIRDYGKIKPELECKSQTKLIPEKKDNRLNGDIYYPMQHVIKKQPTFYTCGDACAAMLNHFQKIEIYAAIKLLEQLEASLRKMDESIKQTDEYQACLTKLKFYAQFFKKTKIILDQTYHSVQHKSLSKGFRTEEECQRLYNISCVRRIEHKNATLNLQSKNNFVDALKQCLYDAGPLMAEINTGSPFNDHFVIINGVVNGMVCYADSWNGQIKQMRIDEFVEMMTSEELSGLIGVNYKYKHDIDSLREQIDNMANTLATQKPRLNGS